jgi:hypothetical protein
VLQEVRDAAPLGLLVAGAGRHPDAQRDGLNVIDAFGDDAHAVVERRLFNRVGHTFFL